MEEHNPARSCQRELGQGDCEDIGTMGHNTFYEAAMVYATLSSFVIDVKELEVVVEIDASSAKVAAEASCMGSENGVNIDMTLSAERNSQSGLPFASWHKTYRDQK